MKRLERREAQSREAQSIEQLLSDGAQQFMALLNTGRHLESNDPAGSVQTLFTVPQQIVRQVRRKKNLQAPTGRE